MTRKQKADALQAVRDGRLKPSDLLDPVNYVVFHPAEGYHYQGKAIAPDDYRELLAKYKVETARREAAGLPVGYFINVRYGNRGRLPIETAL